MTKTKTEITPVRFLVNDADNDLFAFFPAEDYTDRNDLTKSCYSHVGQHSACSVDYANSCREALPNEYADLKAELEGIGYKLQVVCSVVKGDNITIIGRRWFDRVNGNTYFSAVGIINGIEVVQIPFEYGYGNQYEDRVYQELEKLGYCADVEHYNNGGREAFWRYCDRKRIIKYVTHSDVNRKKDL